MVKNTLDAINKIASIFSFYGEGFRPKPELLALVNWCRNQQTPDDTAEGDHEGSLIGHLSHNLRFIANMINETDETQARFLYELYDKSCKNPEQLTLVSVYEALTSRWAMVKDSSYTYRCLYDLVKMKKDWTPDENDLNKLYDILNDIS